MKHLEIEVTQQRSLNETIFMRRYTFRQPKKLKMLNLHLKGSNTLCAIKVCVITREYFPNKLRDLCCVISVRLVKFLCMITNYVVNYVSKHIMYLSLEVAKLEYSVRYIYENQTVKN